MKVINFGPCFVGDNVYESFILKNTGKGDIRMLAVFPSILIYASPTAITSFEFLRFSPVSPSLPFNLNLGTRMSDTLVIRYSAEADTISEPVGRKESMMKIGLVNPQDTTEIIVQDSFKLIARKTARFVEGFDEIVYFDSVFVSSSSSARKRFNVRNTQNSLLPIISANDSLISQQGSNREFFFESKNYPILIKPKTTVVSWEINYRPTDIGSDTTIFKVYFLPKPDTAPDSSDFCFVKAIGTGVVQDIKIANSNAIFRNDTIDVGVVPIASGKSLQLQLFNDGNIPFGAVNQYFEDELTGEIIDYMELTDEFLSNGSHLLPNRSDDISISIQPKQRGYFSARYVIENDIDKRDIFGYQASDTRLVYYIIGRAVEPSLSLPSDTINFGNIVYSGDIYGDCPSRKDTLLRIVNNGNIDLIIKDISIEDDFRFSISDRELVIPANSEKSVQLSYHSGYPPGTYETKMTIISNAAPPYDSTIVTLIGASILPVLADLSIDKNIKSKPGRTIDIPILLSHESYKAAPFAKFFEIVFTFNPTLLKFTSYQTLSTASEGSYVEIDDSVNGNLKLKVVGNDYFLPNDTLIVLRFNTYLGNSISTEIAIQNPIFGSGNCRRVIDTKIDNGEFRLDSICGLPVKILPQAASNNIYFDISPNPAESFIKVAGKNLSTKHPVEFNIMNSFGTVVKSFYFDNRNTDNNFILDLQNLPSGSYFVEQLNGNNRLIKPFILRK